MRSAAMYRLVRGSIATALGSFVGLPVAFVLSPDPVGIVPILAGLLLTAVLAAGFYLGMGTVMSAEPD